SDKDWKSALSVQEFLDLKSNVEQEQKEKEFSVDNSRKKRVKRTRKPLDIAGYDADKEVAYVGPSGRIFEGLNFCMSTPSHIGALLTMNRYLDGFEHTREEVEN